MLATPNTTTASLFVVFLIFKFNIVSVLSLFREFLPEARATMRSGYKAAAGVCCVIGALLTAGGICLLGLIALPWATRT